MKKVKEIDVKIPNFHYVTLEELLSVKGKIYDTGFFVQNTKTNKYIYTVLGNSDFYVIDANSKEYINKMIVKEDNRKEELRYREELKHNKKTIKCTRLEVGKRDLTVCEILSIYKYFSSNILVDDYFRISGSGDRCSYREFLSLVKEVLLLEEEIEKRKISYSDKEQIMKVIYDKYKMECLYYNPIDNYGDLNKASHAHQYDQKNMLAPHAFDPIGLIVYKYATCQGMAYGLAELCNYFGIDAEVARNKIHAITKVNFEENGRKYVSYIDLSREISPDFTDCKFIYKDGRAIERALLLKRANIDSYRFYLKKRLGIDLGDKDSNISFDHNEEDNIKIYRRR